MEPLPPGSAERSALPPGNKIILELNAGPIITPPVRRLPRGPDPVLEAVAATKAKRRKTK